MKWTWDFKLGLGVFALGMGMIVLMLVLTNFLKVHHWSNYLAIAVFFVAGVRLVIGGIMDKRNGHPH